MPRMTKAELVQINAKLAEDNTRLRAELSALRFEQQTAKPSDFRARCAEARRAAMETGKVVSV